MEQEYKSRDQIEREIKKDVIVYAQERWPVTFSRVFQIHMLSSPLIDEVPIASISIGKDKIRLVMNDTSILLGEINYSEITEIICDQ